MTDWLDPTFLPKEQGLEAGHTSSIRRPARGRGEPEPVQQVRGAPQRIWHAEQPHEQRRDPGQRPPLVFIRPVDGRVASKVTQPCQLILIQPAVVPPGPFDASAASPPARQARAIGTPILVLIRSSPASTSCANNCAACNRALPRRDRPSGVSPPLSGSDTSQHRDRHAGNANHADARNVIKQTRPQTSNSVIRLLRCQVP
jgi:hypothetical protein